MRIPGPLAQAGMIAGRWPLGSTGRAVVAFGLV
jgi:hypothetical protein